MSEDYLALEAALKAIGIPCAENGWTTRPKSDYITYALEFEADADHGDNRKVARAWEGSIDLYCSDKRGGGYPSQIEAVLAEHCDGCWQMETCGRWERETGLFHFEWSFEVLG